MLHSSGTYCYPHFRTDIRSTRQSSEEVLWLLILPWRQTQKQRPKLSAVSTEIRRFGKWNVTLHETYSRAECPPCRKFPVEGSDQSKHRLYKGQLTARGTGNTESLWLFCDLLMKRCCLATCFVCGKEVLNLLVRENVCLSFTDSQYRQSPTYAVSSYANFKKVSNK